VQGGPPRLGIALVDSSTIVQQVVDLAGRGAAGGGGGRYALRACKQGSSKVWFGVAGA